MTTPTRILNHPLCFILLAALAVFYFGHGIYASYQAEREDRANREYVRLVNKIDHAKVGKTIQLRGKGFFVTRMNGLIGDEAFQEAKR